MFQTTQAPRVRCTLKGNLVMTSQHSQQITTMTRANWVGGWRVAWCLLGVPWAYMWHPWKVFRTFHVVDDRQHARLASRWSDANEIFGGVAATIATHVLCDTWAVPAFVLETTNVRSCS